MGPLLVVTRFQFSKKKKKKKEHFKQSDLNKRFKQSEILDGTGLTSA